jgi:CTP:molybdopterin cytidylyltransferase MocA
MGGNALLEGAEVTLVPAESGWELWDLDTREDLQRMCGILKSLSENPE